MNNHFFHAITEKNLEVLQSVIRKIIAMFYGNFVGLLKATADVCSG